MQRSRGGSCTWHANKLKSIHVLNPSTVVHAVYLIVSEWHAIYPNEVSDIWFTALHRLF